MKDFYLHLEGILKWFEMAKSPEGMAIGHDD